MMFFYLMAIKYSRTKICNLSYCFYNVPIFHIFNCINNFIIKVYKKKITDIYEFTKATSQMFKFQMNADNVTLVAPHA